MKQPVMYSSHVHQPVQLHWLFLAGPWDFLKNSAQVRLCTFFPATRRCYLCSGCHSASPHAATPRAAPAAMTGDIPLFHGLAAATCSCCNALPMDRCHPCFVLLLHGPAMCCCHSYVFCRLCRFFFRLTSQVAFIAGLL